MYDALMCIFPKFNNDKQKKPLYSKTVGEKV